FSGVEKNDFKHLLVEPSTFWETHYNFQKPSVKRSKKIGLVLINSLVINSVVPFMMVVAERQLKPALKQQAMEMLNSIPSEKNVKTELFRSLGLKVPDAATSQALIELKTQYCDLKKCLSCAVGIKLLKSAS
ncbi:DUF2851 family protein, partial [Bacteroidota bacterium]